MFKKAVSLLLALLLLVGLFPMQAFAASKEDTYEMTEEVISQISGYLSYPSTSFQEYFHVPYDGGTVTFDFTGSTKGYYILQVYEGNSYNIVASNTGEYGPAGFRGIPCDENTVLELPQGYYRVKVTAADRGLTELDYTFKAVFNKTFTTEDPYYYLDPSPVDYVIYADEPVRFRVKALPSSAKVPKATWSVSDTSIAKVTEYGTVSAKGTGYVTLIAAVGNQEFYYQLYAVKPSYSKLKDFSLYVDGKKTLKIEISPSDYPYQKITWSSSDKSVATVSSKGVVTAKKAGKAEITATINGKTTRSCTVTVKKMAITNTSKTIYVDDTYTLKVNGGSGSTSWSSSNKSVAKVSSSGKVTALKPGTATITAKKDGKTFTCKVTVKWAPENGVTKTKTYKLPDGCEYTSETLTLKGKTTVTISAQIKSSGGYMHVNIRDDNFKNWISMNISEKDGKVTEKVTLPAGTYTLSYSADEDATFTLKRLTKPQIISSTKNVGRGYTLKLKTTGVINDGVTWSSSNKSIATVSSSGTVKGKKNGTCTIYCKLKDGTKISTKITVRNPVGLSVVRVDDENIYNDCYVKFTNYTNKTIDYIEFNIYQYNYKGSRVQGPYSYYFWSDNISAGKNATGCYWVHDHAETCKLSIIEVKFTDGTYWKP